MGKSKYLSVLFQKTSILAILGLLLISLGCNRATEPYSDVNVDKVEELHNSRDIIWHIRAVHPEGILLDVKAFDKDNNAFDIKAIQDSDQRSFMDIKAIVGKKRLPVKILVSGDKYTRVKALADDGSVYDIKALTPEGKKLDVKGISRADNIIHIKAINEAGDFYGIKAFSPKGQLNDVKGVKMTDEQTEVLINGHAVYAHVKALPPAGCISNSGNWLIKAIHPDGYFLDVKALDNKGNILNVQAIQDFQRSLMDVKALVGDKKLPIKMLVSNDKYAPIKAISEDGTIYDIKALTPEGDKLDVKGVKRSGNIIHIKAINKKGDFYGVKAISLEGELNDVKGIKLTKEKTEMLVNGVGVHAHIKAIQPID